MLTERMGLAARKLGIREQMLSGWPTLAAFIPFSLGEGIGQGIVTPQRGLVGCLALHWVDNALLSEF